MKHKTSELEGALLDAAVAKAEGKVAQVCPSGSCWVNPDEPFRSLLKFDPSSNPVLGDAIIERERIATWASDDGWGAEHPENPSGYYSLESGILDTSMMLLPTGADRLTAAMRAYVASKLGDEVEL